ncbi:hypothetical protein MMYC01_209123 [Madurella mycetomatis]|uniref:LysM domain-containing protein n=1 Tax=Madurella mycetomatis TaxID=100816 RepID=A0A175VZI7_9PEZI|nr:hypothetical protein MMYC01_209123 [Madurella mycetomatis]
MQFLFALHWVLIAAAAASRDGFKRGRRQGSEDGREGPIEPDTASDCTYFDTVHTPSDNCTYFEQWWGISHEDFIKWNPSVEPDCSGIKIGNSYCVEVNWGIPSTTTTTAAPTSTTTPKPSPTQPGLIDTCTKFYRAVSGDICVGIAAAYGNFTFADFLAWNPAVGQDCSGLRAGWYYCVQGPKTPTTVTSSPTPTETCNPTAPTPTQPVAICGCTKWHEIVSGDTCSVIIQQYELNGEDFYRWNSNVGAGCELLWLGYYVCVGA